MEISKRLIDTRKYFEIDVDYNGRKSKWYAELRKGTEKCIYTYDEYELGQKDYDEIKNYLIEQTYE